MKKGLSRIDGHYYKIVDENCNAAFYNFETRNEGENGEWRVKRRRESTVRMGNARMKSLQGHEIDTETERT